MDSASIGTPIPGSSHERFLANLSAAGETPAASKFLGRWMLWLLAGFLVITTFEGALRFYAAQAGVAWIIYAKDALLIVAVLLGIANTLLTDLRNPAFWVVCSLLTIGTVVGLVILPDPRQPLFAAKTWLPLLCGTVAGAMIAGNSRFLYRLCVLLWLAAVAGIALTAFWSAPWVGFVYELAGMEVEGSREWTIGDSVRAAGFSRASFDAALQCLFFGAIIALPARVGVGLCIWLISAGAVFLAVSRTVMAALAVAVALYFAVRVFRPAYRLAKLGVVLLALAVIALPFAASVYYKDVAGMADTTSVTSTSSFEERALKTWPDGLALVSRGGNPVTGRGLGGIGVAQQFFETDRFNPGDNLFIYLWGALGSLGVALILFFAFQVWRAPAPLSQSRQTAIVMVGAFLAVGLTLNAIEAAIASLFLGIALVWLTDPRLEE